jgi:hypothetical protein
MREHGSEKTSVPEVSTPMLRIPRVRVNAPPLGASESTNRHVIKSAGSSRRALFAEHPGGVQRKANRLPLFETLTEFFKRGTRGNLSQFPEQVGEKHPKHRGLGFELAAERLENVPDLDCCCHAMSMLACAYMSKPPAFTERFKLRPAMLTRHLAPCSHVPCLSVPDLQTIQQRKEHQRDQGIADGAEQFGQPAPLDGQVQQEARDEQVDRTR